MSHIIMAGVKEYADKVTRLYERYIEYVRKNPAATAQLESTVRTLSYLIAGDSQTPMNFQNLFSQPPISWCCSMTASSGKTKKCIPCVSVPAEAPDLALVLESVEVFLEVGACKVGGEVGRWVVIGLIQIIKAVFRLILLLWYKSGIGTSPPIIPLDRNTDFGAEDGASAEQQEDSCFVGQRSGRVIRPMGSGASAQSRIWPPPQSKSRTRSPEEQLQIRSTDLNLNQITAEAVYVTRPLVHLLSLAVCGKKSWKPWILSAALELSSFAVLNNTKFQTQWERAEMRRRSFLLLYYLLRSPFYDRYSEEKILFLLKLLSDYVPGVGYVARPLMDYLPSWQKIYFYNWG
ncbi:hypothetical protein WMY93_012862 [Mugilogobius chulae]|uniref:Peroxisomal membrane protein PEX16 n=1 Tax=Mugilogobius chulae TaxID=88201 RepID=A0AAW0NYC4_9GOBI